MSRLAVIVPTRGRPANAARLDAAFGDTERVYACDDTDPCLPGYECHLGDDVIVYPGHPTMIEKLNTCATALADEYEFLGFLGDDVVPRTPDWQAKVEAALDALPGPGLVYVNDLFQGPNLPAHVFMHAELVRRLGWMALPTVKHLYCDNAWLDLGTALGAITYLHGVVIEHLHPHAGKAEGDDQYARVNADEAATADRLAWEHWREHQLPLDVAKVRGVQVA